MNVYMHGAPSHTHDGNALTIGCPACIYRSQRAQYMASWAEAPIRRCTWVFEANGRTRYFKLDVRVPTGVECYEVDEWYAGDTGPAISDILGELPADDNGRTFYEACESIYCSHIGAIVTPTVAQSPSLFDGAA